MHYFLYPTKDAFISSNPVLMFKNTGLDEVLEIEKRTSYYACGSTEGNLGAVLTRALLYFDLTQISQSIACGQITNPRFYLNLKVCESMEVPSEYTLAAYPISESWQMGTGYKFDENDYSDGVSWKFRDGQTKLWYSSSVASCDGGGVWWVSGSLVGSGSGYVEPPYVNPNPYDLYPDCPSTTTTAAPTPPVAPVIGGLACSQSFYYQSSDVRMDVTNIVNAWISSTVVNNGLIVMHSDETSSVDYGTLRFFSKETNTIYSPYLDVAWEDSEIAWMIPGFNTSSAEPIQIRDAVVSMKNMAKEYKYGSILRMDVTPRKRYPIKTFARGPSDIQRFSDYLYPYYLPSSSYYVIKDAESEEDVIPYDAYTQLSFDSYGNYFMLDTSGLPQERYFKVQIRAEQSGSIMTFDIPTPFKISR
jgi:hypothetical protein